MLSLGHPDVKASFLIGGIVLSLGHMTAEGGFLISVVKRQLVKSGLHVARGKFCLRHLALKLGLLVGGIQRSFGHLVAEAGLLIGSCDCSRYCTSLLIGVVDSELVKGNL